MHQKKKPGAYNNERLYQVFHIPKRSKDKLRAIQNPVARLKNVQKVLLSTFLNKIPLGTHVGAYVPGRSCAETALQHIGRGLIISLDIRDFFPSVKQAMIRSVFRKLGYNHFVASLMSGLVVYRNFLPQGAPTSGFIANLVADRTFDREIIDALKAMDDRWVYTRYSDDVDISHPQMQPDVAVAVVIETVRRRMNAAGFHLNEEKTKVEPYWKRQKVLGMVVNKKLNIPRLEYARLRCLIHNCMVYGFDSQYKRAGQKNAAALEMHIQGKLNYINQIDKEKARRLATKFELAKQMHSKIDEVNFGESVPVSK